MQSNNDSFEQELVQIIKIIGVFLAFSLRKRPKDQDNRQTRKDRRAALFGWLPEAHLLRDKTSIPRLGVFWCSAESIEARSLLPLSRFCAFFRMA